MMTYKTADAQIDFEMLCRNPVKKGVESQCHYGKQHYSQRWRKVIPTQMF